MANEAVVGGYHFDIVHSMWTPPGEAEAFGYNDGDAHETFVASVIRNASDLGTGSNEIERHIHDWPSRYHLSRRRGSLVHFLKDVLRGPILELGAGMGAVTRALAETGVDVVAVEGSRRRAAVCAERCRDLPNVTVVNDTILNFRPAATFSTILLVGVLEYARAFPGDGPGDPVDALLDHASSLLEPGGELIVAIENKFGMKYLAGFPEDHLGTPMVGVEGRYPDDGPVTFTRAELAERLRAAGLPQHEWAYAFPDYKLPVTVVTEAGVQASGDFDVAPLVAAGAQADAQEPDRTTFDVSAAWSIAGAGPLIGELAHSFVVRASREPLSRNTHLAVYFGAYNRRPEFEKVTIFDRGAAGAVEVRRSFLHPSASHRVGPYELILTDEPHLSLRPWSDRLRSVMTTPGWTVEDIVDWSVTWWDALARELGTDPDQLRRADVVDGRVFDALPRNLLYDGTDGTFIDLEWRRRTGVTPEFLVFRGLWDSLQSVGQVARPAADVPVRIRDLMRHVAEAAEFPLSAERVDLVWQEEMEFQSTVTGHEVSELSSAHLDLELCFQGGFEEILHDLARGELAQADVQRLSTNESTLRAEVERLSAEGQALRAEVERLSAEERALRAEIERLLMVEAELRGEIDRRGDAIAHGESVAAELGNALSTARAELTAAETNSSSLAQQHDAASAIARSLRRDLEVSRHEAAEARSAADLSLAQLNAAQATISWRATAPLRRVRARLPRLVEGRSSTSKPSWEGGVPPASALPLAEPAGAPGAATWEFDVRYYRLRYPDLAGLSDAALRQHFLDYGVHEGRRSRGLLAETDTSAFTIDPSKPSILVVLHDASRTGAPILGWNLVRELSASYNCIVVLIDGGELLGQIQEDSAATVVLDRGAMVDLNEARCLAQDLIARFSPVYALANSGATHLLVPGLEESGLPVVLLLHEYSSSLRPAGILNAALEAASEVVVPARAVLDSFRREYAISLARRIHVTPQGRSLIPPGGHELRKPLGVELGVDGVPISLPEVGLEEVLASLGPEDRLVVGAGVVSPRKGVEFFIQAADHLARRSPAARTRFLWVGDRADHLSWYVEELHAQLLRSAAPDVVTFAAPSPELETLFRRADVFFLSSRLDPMPNVTIDASLAGVPTVAFAQGSGFADWLAESPETQSLVVPYLDATAAADAIGHLVEHPETRALTGERLQARAVECFDLARYAQYIDALGRAAAERRLQEALDCSTVEELGDFDPEFAGGADASGPVDCLIRRYVHSAAVCEPLGRPRTGQGVRRPAEGFHPLVFAERAPCEKADPYAEYLRQGRPDGPWVHEVITPAAPDRLHCSAEAGRVLVHAHLHYPELLKDLDRRLGRNSSPVDLVVTTTSKGTASTIRGILDELNRENVDVRVVPNRGRDLGAFFTGLSWDLVSGYSVVAHVHGKKSPHVHAETGDRWRWFLWENLIGGHAAMLDRISLAFTGNELLGLVAPEDPHLNDWDLNREIATDLRARLGIDGDLHNHLDFPIGGMFVANPLALKPFFDARFAWEEYPQEPLPIDGTIVHAMERLLSVVCEERGFQFAKTSVPGVRR